jgi:arylsulfatase A-like enzyme
MEQASVHTNRMSHQKSWFSLLMLLIGLGIFIQLAWFITYTVANHIISLSSISSVTEAINIRDISLTVVSYLACQILVNGVFVALLWYVVKSLRELLKWNHSVTLNFVTMLWVMACVTVLAANSYYFPNSIFSFQIPELILKPLFSVSLFVWVLITVLMIINMSISLAKRKNILRHTLFILFLLTVAYTYADYFRLEKPNLHSAATVEKPNVFIIGIDALRPDFTSFNNSKYAQTPSIDNFLRSASLMTNAYTPLARTFPAWVSILTSLYPSHSNARENLANFKEMKLNDTLADKFNSQGYETYYGSDDSAWSAIDKRFGFQHVTKPPENTGVLLIGLINDFPLSNLLLTSPFGRILFPGNYANHLFAFSYDPNNFLHLLKVQLHSRTGEPVFMAVHFNVNGWPGGWAQSKRQDSDFEGYKDTLIVTDQQIGKFLTILKDNKLLDHALVVLLSDHGTGLGLPGDRLTAENLYQGDKSHIKLIRPPYDTPIKDKEGHTETSGIDTSYGYGGDVLSRATYHTLLAFRGYGFDIGTAKEVNTSVSLIDIAPTVLELLKMPVLAKADGVSLRNALFNNNDIDIKRPLFMETSLSFTEITQPHISIPEVVKKAASLFHVDAQNGTVSMKPAALNAISQNAEKAVLQDHWLLANLPASTRYRQVGAGKFVSYITPPQFILVDITTGRWTAELDSQFAQSAPVGELYAKLLGFYGREINQ